jgi:amino acid adenylation domain-containing protein
MSIAAFVSDLRKLDVRLSVKGQRLRVNAPKGVLTDSLRARIAERKQELLQFFKDYEQSAAFIPPPILRRTSSDPAPLSFAQERLGFLEQLEPGSAVYNICRPSRLTGQLNIAALESSLSEIVRRHEILRSQICIVDGLPVQMTVTVSRFKLPVTDLRPFTETERDREVRERIKTEAEWQFDFSAGLFLRAVLLQISNDQHILILTTHHIVADAWSMGILTQELWTLYDAYANGRPSPLQELPIQYADYAFWQREWLQGEVLESQLSYWKEQLKELPILNLPTDHPRPAKQSFRGARKPLLLPESLTKAVNELSGREGVTQFMTLLAAFQVLVYRYSGQEDVVVGLPIANRNRTEIEGLIGFFVNTLVLRTDLSEKPTFKVLLQRIRNVCLEAYAHQDMPFEKLVEELRPERDLSRNPLFQVMFVLQNTPRPLPQPTPLSIERFDVLPATSLFDLSLYLREREGKLIGFVEYNTDLFDSSTIERMIGHFETLLEGIVADPERPISTLPLLTEAERHQVLVEWNDTETEYPKDVCIHELFEAQAATTPESIALEFEGKQLTYRELNRRANQLAHYLRRLGIGPEKLVGICIERSIEMVIGLLGILKAGGAYVPLDPSYPKERLAFMLDDSQASVLLTSEPVIEKLKIGDSDSRSSILDPQMKLVCLDANWGTVVPESEQNISSEMKPDNLAYVIYTSGSTGQPKGVAIEHRNTVALLHWAKSVFTPEELSGVLASTSICFDLSIFELFVPLSWGGKVILMENVLQLPSGSGRHQVTLINTVPSAMTELLRINGLPESLRTVNLAGEPLRSDLVEQIYGWRNVNKVYDLYGPSETTTYSTFVLRTREGPTTIGRPIANTRIFILDSCSQPVAVGGEGELYIGGDGVARGYLNRPELTSERFVRNPLGDDPARRLYRTGDRARYRPDGNIEFLGRTDNQVKIRGYRIELGEIEAALNQHPTIKESVVVARDRDSNLIGYFVLKGASPIAISGLRNFLREKLPDYMVPPLLVELEVLPLLPNGKIDRIALRSLDHTKPELKETYVVPRTRVEELLVQIWKEVLQIRAVGIHDNFFELGGHSLLAIQIMSRVCKALDKEVPLSALFDTPTVAGLAAAIEKTISGRTNELPPIKSTPRHGPLPQTLNQEHLWRIDQMIPGNHYFNMPYVYRLTGDLNVDAMEKAFREMIRRHEVLRTVFAEIDSSPVQIIRTTPDFRLPIVDLRCQESVIRADRAADRIVAERSIGFDLTVGPLLRVEIIRLTDADYLLLVTMHHIIGDEWSIQVFRRELLSLYGAFADGWPLSLPDPPIQFGDYALWEKRLLDRNLLDLQLNFWERKLKGPREKLLFDQAVFNNRHSHLRREHRSMEIAGSLFADFKSFAARENSTHFTIVTSAFTVLLHSLTGQRDIHIGILVANRRRVETHEILGHLVNTIVFRCHLRKGITYRELIGETWKNLIDAYNNQEIPFEAVVRALQIHHIERSKLVQVLLAYNFAPEAAEVSGLKFAPMSWAELKMEEYNPLTSFDVVIRFTESSTKLRASVNCKESLLNGEFAACIDENFRAIMAAIIFKPDSAISL